MSLLLTSNNINFPGKFSDKNTSSIKNIRMQINNFSYKSIKKKSKEYKYLIESSNCKYFPKIYGYSNNDNVFIEVLEKIDILFLINNLRDLFSGLEYLHNILKISHNDIKLSNLAQKNNHIVIIDLSIATPCGYSQKKIGTPYTMAINMHKYNYVSDFNDAESVLYEILESKYYINISNISIYNNHESIAIIKQCIIDKILTNSYHELYSLCEKINNARIYNNFDYKSISF